MRKAILVALMFLAVGEVKAVSDPDIIRSSATVISPIAISSTTVTQIDAGLSLLTGRFFVMIDNEGSEDVRCSFSDNVTTTSNGFLVKASATEPLKLKVLSTMSIYCIAVGPTASMNISLTQGRAR